MFEKLRRSKLMFWTLELLMLATLVMVSSQIKFLFGPIVTFISTLFAPVLIAGFLFYILNPVVNWLEKKKISRVIGTLLVFVLLVLVTFLFMVSIIPNLINQFSRLMNGLPSMIQTMESWLDGALDHPLLRNIDIETYIDKMDISIANIIKTTINNLSLGIGSFVSSVASIVIVTVTVPFVLFYMLKDGHRLLPAIKPYLPEKQREGIISLLGKLNQTMSRYIAGQAIECCFVAVFTFIGYQLIGIEYAFLFGMMAGLFNMIPYIGPYLGLAPAVLVTIFANPWQALWACVVVLIVQQIDGNIVYPNVIGKSLAIHPLTIIFILLVAGNLAGLLGMILGVPFYAICKTIVTYLYNIIKLGKVDQTPDKS